MLVVSGLKPSELSALDLGVLSAMLGAIFFFVFVRFARDLAFYRKNHWNFKLDSGRNLFYGSTALPENKMSNKARILFGYPFCLVVTALVFVIPAIELVRRFSD